LGSGSGKLGTRLADYFKNSIIVDIDKSSPVIKRLKNIFNRDKLRMPKLGDARNIPLEKGSVDLIVAYSTLRYINDRRKVIESINKILKSGGYAVIVEARAIDVVEDIESTLKNKRIAFTRNTENNILFSRTSFFYYLVLESSKNKILKNRIEKVENKNNSSFLEAALKCAGKYKGSLYYVSWQKKNG
jgi:ubiquinone/menaquinone biosynthesis C-methylase UbiE